MANLFINIPYCTVFFFTFVITLLIINNEAAPQGSLITSLPGFNGTLPSKHYSGYISFKQKNMFYYFIVSERNPSKDPVVLWLNGGPGCSSFDGFIYEHGPFNYGAVKAKGSLPALHLNPYSWSKVSNIVYLDSPCGVGLSYSTNDSNYETDDFQTAIDTHTFLLKWFKLYPEFSGNPFYISGESYAGIYVPTLASQVVAGIKSRSKPIINFKGYLVGNGISNSDADGFEPTLRFIYGTGLISDDIYQDIQTACKGHSDDSNYACLNATSKIKRLISELNVYDILEPCYDNIESRNNNNTLNNNNKKRTMPPWASTENGSPRWWHEFLELPAGSVRCVDDVSAYAWLNDESVRKAIHAQPKRVAGAWEICSDKISYGFGAPSMLPIHKNLTSLGYRALIYSGDHDMRVPYTGSQAWIKALRYKIVDEWRPWFSNRQVAGFVQGYEHGLTFLTIKGAGHMVPQNKPREALDFYTRWLDAQPI